MENANTLSGRESLTPCSLNSPSFTDFPTRSQVSPGSAREAARKMKLDAINKGKDRLVLIAQNVP